MSNLTEEELKAVLLVFNHFVESNPGLLPFLHFSEEFKNGEYNFYRKIIKSEKLYEKEFAEVYERIIKLYLNKIQNK